MHANLHGQIPAADVIIQEKRKDIPMNSTKPSTIAEFLEYIEIKYGKSASWIGERAGLSGSTARRWKTQTSPYESSLNLIEAVVEKDFPKELELYKEIRQRLNAPVCKEYEVISDSKVLSSQMKELENIIRNRYPDGDEEFMQGSFTSAAKLLVNHGYEFALEFAKNFTVSKEEDEDRIMADALSDYYEFRRSLPEHLTLEQTPFCTYSYKIIGVDGFYADIMPTPHDSFAIYLWHEDVGQKLLVHDLNSNVLELFGSIKPAAEIILQDVFAECMTDYLGMYMFCSDEFYEDENGDITNAPRGAIVSLKRGNNNGR